MIHSLILHENRKSPTFCMSQHKVNTHLTVSVHMSILESAKYNCFSMGSDYESINIELWDQLQNDVTIKKNLEIVFRHSYHNDKFQKIQKKLACTVQQTARGISFWDLLHDIWIVVMSMCLFPDFRECAQLCIRKVKSLINVSLDNLFLH